jgi:hypothetical protein
MPKAMWCLVQQSHFTFIPKSLFGACSSIFTYGVANCLGVLLIGKNGVGLAHISEECYGHSDGKPMALNEVDGAVERLRGIMRLLADSVQPDRMIAISTGAVDKPGLLIQKSFQEICKGLAPTKFEPWAEIVFECATGKVYPALLFNPSIVDEIGPRIVFETLDLKTLTQAPWDEMKHYDSMSKKYQGKES